MLIDMPPLCRQVTLKPSVGFTSLLLSVPDVTWAKIVLFPAFSKPSTRIRLSGLSSNYDTIKMTNVGNKICSRNVNKSKQL